MQYFRDAKELVDHANVKLGLINNEYEKCLSSKNIDARLLIEIKNFMENLRSALDFCAHGLFEKYGSSKKKNPRIYFPYARVDHRKEDFRKNQRIESSIPGISSKREIVEKLESYQHFENPINKWLPLFMDLNNENKHQKLTPQTRTETKQLNISSGNTRLSLGEGATLTVGKNALIQIGGMTILGGQSISANSPARTIGPGQQEVITWVSFRFATNDEPVMPLLNDALNGVDKIVKELSCL